jgi:tetratricopeptide (TPR) repeat protein
MRRFRTAFTGGKRLNARAFLILVASLVASGTAVYFAHAFQMRRNAHELLEQADLAEREGSPRWAAQCLRAYLELEPWDGEVQARYGLLLARQARSPVERGRAFLALERALYSNPGRIDVRRQAAQLAIFLRRFGDAAAHLDLLFKVDAQADAELLYFRGLVEHGQLHYPKAAQWYAKAVRQAPRRVEYCLTYALLLREHLKSPLLADEVVEALAGAEPQSPAARLEAARYFRRFNLLDRAEIHAASARKDRANVTEEALLLAADIALARGQTVQARGLLEQGRARFPKSTSLARELVLLELREGNKDRALVHARYALHGLGEDAEEVWAVANLCIEAGEPGIVAGLLRKLTKSGRVPLASALRARLLMQQEAWGEARNLLVRVRPQLPKSSAAAKQLDLFLAECHERLGSPDEQEQAYRHALARDAEWPPARLGLAAALAAAGRLDQALAEYRRLPGASPAVRAEMVRLMLLKNLQLPSAQRRWEEVDRLLEGLPTDGADFKLVALRADVLVARERPEQARQLVRAQRDRDRKAWQPWLYLIRLAEVEGKTEAILPLIEQAEQAAGNHVQWLLARARYWAADGTPEIAGRLQELRSSLDRLKGDDADALRLTLADVLWQLGDWSEAEKLWKEVALRQPRQLAVQSLLLERARQRGHEAELLVRLEQVRRLEGGAGPRTAYGEAAHAVLQARRGKRSALLRARAWLAKASALRPSWPLVPLLEAETYEAEGEKEKALEKYRLALRLGETRLGVARRALQLMYELGMYGEANALVQELSEPSLAVAGLGRLASQVSLASLEEKGDESPQGRQRALELARKGARDSKDYRDHLWLGQVNHVAGRPQEAEAAFRRARELAPASPEAWALLLMFLAKTDPTKAAAELGRAHKEVPRTHRHLVLAVCLEALGKVEEAAQHYRAAVDEAPRDAPALRAIAGFYARHNRLAEAEPFLRALLERFTWAPASTAAWARRSLALVLSSQGGYRRFQQALTLLQENDKGRGEAPEDRLARALVLATQSAHQREALRLFEALAPRRAQWPAQTRLLLGYLYEATGDWRSAEEHLLALALAREPDPAHVAEYIRALLRHGKADEAQRWVDRLARLGTSAETTLELRIFVLKARGRAAEAVEQVRTYVRGKRVRIDMAAMWMEYLGSAAEAEKLYREFASTSGRPESNLLLARFLARHERAAEALQLCDRAWPTCRPEDVAHASVSILLTVPSTEEQQRRVEQALAKAIAERAPSRLLSGLLAQLYSHQGRFADAVVVYRDMLKWDPHATLAMHNLAYLLALAQDDTRAALALINQAIDAEGPTAEFLDARGVIHLRAGRADLAVTDLEQALAQASRPSAFFHLAQARLVGNNRPDAREAWRRALAAGLTRDSLNALERPAFERLTREFQK